MSEDPESLIAELLANAAPAVALAQRLRGKILGLACLAAAAGSWLAVTVAGFFDAGAGSMAVIATPLLLPAVITGWYWKLLGDVLQIPERATTLLHTERADTPANANLRTQALVGSKSAAGRIRDIFSVAGVIRAMARFDELQDVVGAALLVANPFFTLLVVICIVVSILLGLVGVAAALLAIF